MKVLIIDDFEVMRRAMARALLMSGVPKDGIREAATGLEALEAFNNQPWDLILCDISMPDISGLEILRRFRELRPGYKTRVVMITGSASKSHVSESLANGASGYILKPFTVAHIKELVVSVANAMEKEMAY